MWQFRRRRRRRWRRRQPEPPGGSRVLYSAERNAIRVFEYLIVFNAYIKP